MFARIVPEEFNWGGDPQCGTVLWVRVPDRIKGGEWKASLSTSIHLSDSWLKMSCDLQLHMPRHDGPCPLKLRVTINPSFSRCFCQSNEEISRPCFGLDECSLVNKKRIFYIFPRDKEFLGLSSWCLRIPCLQYFRILWGRLHLLRAIGE